VCPERATTTTTTFHVEPRPLAASDLAFVLGAPRTALKLRNLVPPLALLAVAFALLPSLGIAAASGLGIAIAVVIYAWLCASVAHDGKITNRLGFRRQALEAARALLLACAVLVMSLPPSVVAMTLALLFVYVGGSSGESGAISMGWRLVTTTLAFALGVVAVAASAVAFGVFLFSVPFGAIERRDPVVAFTSAFHGVRSRPFANLVLAATLLLSTALATVALGAVVYGGASFVFLSRAWIESGVLPTFEAWTQSFVPSIDTRSLSFASLGDALEARLASLTILAFALASFGAGGARIYLALRRLEDGRPLEWREGDGDGDRGGDGTEI